MARRTNFGSTNLPVTRAAYDQRMAEVLNKLDMSEDVYGEYTTPGNVSFNGGTSISVICPGAVVGAPYFFNVATMSVAATTCPANPPSHVWVNSNNNVTLRWSSATQTAGDVLSGAGSVIFVIGQRVKRK